VELQFSTLGFINVVMFKKLTGWVFAILISYGAILPVLYGGLGEYSGSKYVTALALAALIGGLFFSSLRSDFIITVPDCLFLLFCLSIAITFGTTPFSSDLREVILLVFSLSSYVAARSVPLLRMAAVRDACMSVSFIIVVVGGALTLHALVQQWNDPHGKPIVLGFDHLVIMFTQSLGILAIAFACTKWGGWRSWIVVCVIVAGICLFAVSLVRATFISLAAALILAGLLHSSTAVKWRILAAVVVVLSLVVVGLLARPGTGEMMVNYLFASNSGATGFIGRPSCGLNIDMYNSVAIRKALYQDAAYLLPQAGFFGLGLGGFLVGSCLPNLEVHNIVVQAFIEFGWGAGSLLVLLIVTCAAAVISKARTDDAARFVACGLAFFVIEYCFHGQISGDIETFAFLGLAARFAERSRLKLGSQSPIPVTS
jgi:hypothetical protein